MGSELTGLAQEWIRGEVLRRHAVTLVVAVAGALLWLANGGQLAQAQTTPAMDRAALEALYDATGGTSWTTSTNWKDATKPLSDWHGVTTNQDGRVTQLDLTSNNLAGSLPAALGNLTELNHLRLSHNSLSGSIPAELAYLRNLWVLALNSNSLTGEIPYAFGNMTSLIGLNLGHNQLSGRVPASFGNTIALNELYLDNNKLERRFP